MEYPWLQAGREQFARLHAQLPHALLIYGRPGLAKHTLAMEMVAALLCGSSVLEGQERRACGRCKNCEMFLSHNHPDFHFLSSEFFVDSAESPDLAYTQRYLEPVEKRGKRKPRRVISVDQVRSLIDSFALASHSAEYKVALIEPAEAMNINAANALLKLLEEPSPGSVLLLVCNDLSHLPVTIRSRCIALAVDAPEDELALSWLTAQGLSEGTARKAMAIAGGAPLIALQYAHSEDLAGFEKMMEVLEALLNQQMNPIEVREKLMKLQSLPVLLSWMQMLLNWIIRYIQEAEAHGEGPWRGYQRPFLALSRRLRSVGSSEIIALYDELQQFKDQDLDVVSPAMLLDKWLISFSRRLV